MSLEHVLPQNYREGEWTDFDGGNKDILPGDFKDRLGNMTLLSASLNREVSNKPFKEKMPHYLSSQKLAASDYIFSCESWGHREIEKNQGKLAKIAKQVWRVDF